MENKYIDAEKLIAEIKGLQCEQGFEDGMEERGYQLAIKDILNIITSLHQEQPIGGKQVIIITETDGDANIHWDCRSLDDARALLASANSFIADKQTEELRGQGSGPDYNTTEGRFRNAYKFQQEQPSDMKSPFTGGKVTILSREEEVTFRGEKVKITRKYYRCEDTGREFTDSKLDDDMMWDTFRAYCEKKGITSFTDIVLKQEQTEVDLEKEFESYLNNMIGQPRMWHPNEQIEWGKSIAHHFAEWGAIHLNTIKEE